MTSTLLTWNIQWGLGVDRRRDPARIVAHARALADFDVLCVQEVAAGFDDLEGLDGADGFAELRALLPDHEAVEAIAVDLPREGGGRRRFGNMIFSRWPVLRVMRHALPWFGDAHSNMPRVLLEATLAAPDGPLRVMTTHLEYFSPELRMAQAEGIRAAHAQAASRARLAPAPLPGPFAPHPESARAILCGDFNMRPDDPAKARLEAPLVDAPPLRDAWRALHGAAAHPHSFCVHDQRYGPPHCCDFVFVTDDLVPRLRAVRYDVETQVSDHQPVVVTLA
ncbi:MAG: endonuclease/exonuclease/phosphatase family protein [Methylobacteriaceae bacterium]|nr:endonuclease/exonuclease/phosphatase family protein [Methylobacteriaceae bacterium]